MSDTKEPLLRRILFLVFLALFIAIAAAVSFRLILGTWHLVGTRMGTFLVNDSTGSIYWIDWNKDGAVGKKVKLLDAKIDVGRELMEKSGPFDDLIPGHQKKPSASEFLDSN